MNKHTLFLVAVIATVLIMGLPELNYYPLLSQGDHGRDLYAAQAVLRGELPYKDFWWVYGPIMPYYYAFFYKVCGATIGSFLLGKLVLKIAAAAFFYLAASRFLPAFLAFLSAVWFAQSQQEFFFTFNHAGGITAELWILFMLFSYIRTPQVRFLWGTLPAIFLYSLIKINFGLTAAVVVAIVSFCAGWVHPLPRDRARNRFYVALAGVCLGVGLVYWLLLKDLPLYVIRQCQPYFGDDQPHHFSPWVTIPYYFTQHWLTFVHSPINMAVGVVLHSGTLLCLYRLCTGKIPAKPRRDLLLCLLTLATFFVLNFQEFVVSGVWYRTFWSLPFLFMFHFLMMHTGFQLLPKVARGLVWVLWGCLLLLGFASAIGSQQQQKIPPRFLQGPHAKIYVGNEFEWTATVNAVNAFLSQNLKDDELFFALPYDDIYYYLAGKSSPTRQLIFFDHIKIPPQQEVSIIEELERKKVKYVLMSNRIASSETGLGIFGRTYCPLLSQYIGANYTPVARQGGDWEKEPGWAHNHGLMILQKK